jgi:hypothetical protein
MARSATRKGGPVLDDSEHDGTLVVVGMTTSEGELRGGWTKDRATSLYAAGQRPRTMMQ